MPLRLQSPYLLCTCSLGLEPIASTQWENRIRNQNGGREKIESCPDHSNKIRLRALRERWRVDVGSKSWTGGVNYSRTLVSPPSVHQRILQCGLHDQEQKTSDDRKIAMETAVLGGGVWSHS